MIPINSFDNPSVISIQGAQERLQETENPELAFDRAREIYKAMGLK